MWESPCVFFFFSWAFDCLRLLRDASSPGGSPLISSDFWSSACRQLGRHRMLWYASLRKKITTWRMACLSSEVQAAVVRYGAPYVFWCWIVLITWVVFSVLLHCNLYEHRDFSWMPRPRAVPNSWEDHNWYLLNEYMNEKLQESPGWSHSNSLKLSLWD